MPVVRELAEGETALGARALLQLRPQVGSVEALVTAIDRVQRPTGYRLLGSFDEGEEDAAAVAGFRIQRNLPSGHHLYVDDLITAADRRGRGHADALFSWLFDEARRHGCTELNLDSAVGPEREDAHRFYFKQGLRIVSYHFARQL